jgi:hypothetical protein
VLIQAIWPNAFTITKKIAIQRAQPLPPKRPRPVRTNTMPRIRWIQPQVVKSQTIMPSSPTVSAESLKSAARPQMMLKTPTIKRRIPAKNAQPLGTVLPIPPVSICVRVACVRGSVTSGSFRSSLPRGFWHQTRTGPET